MMRINNRFEVDALRGEVKDCQTGGLTRLEPRLMKLLCLLIENQGRLLSRSLIIKQVWNDYPGGEEGLNGAISLLRKVLYDEGKQLIETLPKKGYCFHGKLTEMLPTENSSAPINISAPTSIFAPIRKRSRPVYFACIVVMILVAFTLLYDQGREKISTGKLSREESIHLSKIDSLMQAEKLQNK